MDYNALLLELAAPMIDGRLYAILILMLLQVATGIGVAIKAGEFDWVRISDYLKDDTGKVIGWVAWTEACQVLAWAPMNNVPLIGLLPHDVLVLVPIGGNATVTITLIGPIIVEIMQKATFLLNGTPPKALQLRREQSGRPLLPTKEDKPVHHRKPRPHSTPPQPTTNAPELRITTTATREDEHAGH